jgi:hypothetical protein
MIRRGDHEGRPPWGLSPLASCIAPRAGDHEGRPYGC